MEGAIHDAVKETLAQQDAGPTPEHVKRLISEYVSVGDNLRTLVVASSLGDKDSQDELPDVERRIAALDQEITRAFAKLAKAGDVEEIPCNCVIPRAMATILVECGESVRQMRVQIVPDQDSNIDQGRLSRQLPLAKCLCGAMEGETYEYPAPGSRQMARVTVLKIEPPVYTKAA